MWFASGCWGRLDMNWSSMHDLGYFLEGVSVDGRSTGVTPIMGKEQGSTKGAPFIDFGYQLWRLIFETK